MGNFLGRHRPAPGTVLGLIALVVAVAGTAFADPLATNSVLNKKEKKQTRNIARAEIAKAAPNLSVRNAQTATNATNATNAANAANATNAANADLVDGRNATCPAATFLQGGVCFDTAVRFPMTPWNSASLCADAGGRLPSVTELLSIRNAAGVDLGPSGDGHWADLTYDDDGVEEAAMVLDNGDVEFAAVGGMNQMRCAFDLVR